ncbi:MAG: methionyl-tRNA formyltransferase, partial [Alphaproteobacteria bacterium]|nr:methionyl-tRNA formyltransferase [Alphaproteobacteria bacterium]
PPRPAGRGQGEKNSPIHEAAKTLGLKVRTPQNFRNEADRAEFSELDTHVAVVVAYGLLLPPPMLAAPRHGCLNLHGSLLPRWRGAAPIQRAIMAGDTVTGIMVMQMDEGLDTGPVGLVERLEIGPLMTAGELHDEMSVRGADLMARALSALGRDSLHFTPQNDHGVTYAKKIEKAETMLDFDQPASTVHNKIRGLSPFPGAWFWLDLDGRKTRIKALGSSLGEVNGTPGEILDDQFTIACATGAVCLTQVQRQGRKPLPAGEFLRGTGSLAGARVNP